VRGLFAQASRIKQQRRVRGDNAGMTAPLNPTFGAPPSASSVISDAFNLVDLGDAWRRKLPPDPVSKPPLDTFDKPKTTAHSPGPRLVTNPGKTDVQSTCRAHPIKPTRVPSVVTKTPTSAFVWPPPVPTEGSRRADTVALNCKLKNARSAQGIQKKLAGQCPDAYTLSAAMDRYAAFARRKAHDEQATIVADAVALFKTLVGLGVAPNVFCYATLVKAHGGVPLEESLWQFITSAEYPLDSIVCTSLVETCSTRSDRLNVLCDIMEQRNIRHEILSRKIADVKAKLKPPVAPALNRPGVSQRRT
jgi:hypothetical protein